MPTQIAITPVTASLTTQKLDTTAEYQALVDGINSDLVGMDPFVLLGQTVSRADLLAALQRVMVTAGKTKAARLQVLACVADEQAALKIAQPYRKAMKALVIAREGETSPKVQKYGFTQNRTPRKRAAAKATGVTKARATRAATGLKGRQQRAAVTAMPAEAPTTAPAPSPAPATTPTTGSHS